MLITATQPLHSAGAEIFEDHVGGRDQPMDHSLAFLALQIHREAALVAVEGSKKPGPKAAETTGMVALRRGLHLDDVGAELGKHQPGGGPHYRMAELQDAYASDRR